MNLSLLADLTLRGSLVFLAVAAADRLLASRMIARWRRVWWLLVPVTFLLPLVLSAPRLVSPVENTAPLSGAASPVAMTQAAWTPNFTLHISAQPLSESIAFWIAAVWLAGVVLGALLIAIQTWKVHRQWSARRFSTDPELLTVLEDAKFTTGVTAPIGLVVSEDIAAPALLGWLRPRILLPDFLATGPAHELRAVLLHELAHFKNLDIPFNWLFGAVRVIHWFNPLAWISSSLWASFCEEAADECAIRWMQTKDGHAYGEVLLKTLASCKGGPPFGALAIGESLNHLKRRIVMIRNHPTKSNHLAAALAVALLCGLLAVMSPIFADDATGQDADKKAAVAATDAWLAEMDSGDYAKSWSDASKAFRGAVTSEKWTSMSQMVRQPLGKLEMRKVASTLYQEEVPAPDGKTTKGPFVIVQYDTSFENLKFARETVTFQKETDGTWRAAGYYIKPR